MSKTQHTDSLKPVELPQVGQLYHVAWGRSHGVVGRCISIDEENKTATLKTPNTGKLFKNAVQWSDLRHTRRNELTNPH